MSSINIDQINYPKDGTTKKIAINNFSIENVTVDLEHDILSETNNINFKIKLEYIDYSNPGNSWEPYTKSFNVKDKAFSNIVSLCGLQKNVLDKLGYIIPEWNNILTYTKNTLISITLITNTQNSIIYTYMALKNISKWDEYITYEILDIILYNDIYYQSLIDSNTDNIPSSNSSYWVICSGYPNLYTNYWQLIEWNSFTKYPTETLVYYNNVYYDNKQPSRQGLYTCITNDVNTNSPYNNPNQWILQSWDSTITYIPNYLVYYTTTDGTQNLYISVRKNLNIQPDTDSNTWTLTTWNSAWNSTTQYNINNLVYYPDETSYIYRSLINNNITQPNLYPNNWQMKSWSSVTVYTMENLVYYTNTLTQGIYMCLANGITTSPYNNTTEWQLQNWDSLITYPKNYLVYYTASGGTQNLYISTNNTNINIVPGTDTNYWLLTSWTQTWNNTIQYYINSSIIYTISNTDYNYICLESYIVNNLLPSTDNNIDKQPNLYTNFWVLKSWDKTIKYSLNYLVYYTYSIKISRFKIESRQGIYKCLTDNINTDSPYNNETEWQLQNWDATVTYIKNYIVYYTPEGETQTLYISVNNNNTSIQPGTDETYWKITTW